MADFDFSDLDTKPNENLDFSDLNTQAEEKKGPLPPFYKRIIPAGKEVASDLVKGVLATPMVVGRAIGAVPGIYEAAKKEIPLSLAQIQHDPQRALTNVGIGVSKYIAEPTAELPGGIANYLAHIGLIEPESAEAFNKTLLPNGVGLRPEYQQMIDNPQPGDKALQVFGGVAPALPEVPAMIRTTASIVKKPVKMVANAVTDLTKIPGARKAERELAQVTGAATQNEQAINAADRTEDINTHSSYIDTGKSTPKQLQRHINQTQNNINDLANELKSVPETSQNPAESSAHLNSATMVDQQSAQELANAENAISEHLNQGASHDERVAKGIKEHQENTRKEISNQYDELEESLAGKTVEADHAEELAAKTDELTEMVRNNEAHTPAATKLLNQLEKLKGAPSEIPANEYLTALRSAKDYAREARSMAYKHGVNAEERAAWEKRYNDLEEKINKMNDALEQGIGPEDSQKLKEANAAWREKVIPLYRNPTYQKIYHEGKIEGNIMSKLRGTEPGNVLMRDIIKNDPELMKNVIGQQYAEKPDLLHKKNEVAEEYTKRMPELENLKQQHLKAKENVAAARENLKNSLENHKKVTKAHAQRQELMDKKKGLEHQINIAKHHLRKLTESAKRKNILLQDKVKLEADKKKYQQILDEKKDALHRTMTRIKILGGVGLPGGYLINKYLFNGSKQQ